MVAQSDVVPAPHSIVRIVAIAVSGKHFIGRSSPGGFAESWIAGASVVVACVISAWSTRNGQSWAHRLLKVQVCDQDSNLPISGPGMGVREIAHPAGFTSLFIGFLWPLRDDRGQTFADKDHGNNSDQQMLVVCASSPLLGFFHSISGILNGGFD